MKSKQRDVDGVAAESDKGRTLCLVVTELLGSHEPHAGRDAKLVLAPARVDVRCTERRCE